MGYPIPGINKKGEPAKRPRPGVKLQKAQVEPLLIKYEGNISATADALGCNRSTVARLINDDPELQEVVRQCNERLIEEVEMAVWDRAKTGTDTALQCFVLKTKGRHKGWDQSEAQNTAKDIATAAFAFILDKSKNPAENRS